MRSVLLLVVAAAGLALAACGECGEGEGQCDGDVSQVCQDDRWVDVIDCAEHGLSCVPECVAGQACCR